MPKAFGSTTEIANIGQEKTAVIQKHYLEYTGVRQRTQDDTQQKLSSGKKIKILRAESKELKQVSPD